MYERMQSEESFIERVNQIEEQKAKQKKMQELMELRKKAFAYKSGDDWNLACNQSESDYNSACLV